MIVLESDRLRFREHEPGDLEAYCAMEADPEVRRYVGGAPRTRKDAERKFRDVHLQCASDRLALRATIFKPEGRYIGFPIAPGANRCHGPGRARRLCSSDGEARIFTGRHEKRCEVFP